MVGARLFIRKHQLVIFFLLTYLLSWSSVPFAKGGLLPYGPAIAAVIVLGVAGGLQGLRALLARITRWRVRWYWYALAPLIVVGYQSIGFVLNIMFGAAIVRPPQLSIGTVVQLLLLGGMWEEIGWSGYALPKLTEHFASRPNGLLIGILALGAFRALWHVPLLASGAVFWFDVLFFEFAFQIIIAWMFIRTGGSVPVVMLLHFTSNLVGALTANVFSGADRTGYYALFMAVACAFAVAIMWQLRVRPARSTVAQT